MAERRVVVVGASLAAVSVAERLRERGSSAVITLVGDEGVLPYDRPPLSKQLLAPGPVQTATAQLRPPEWYDEQGITLRLGTRAVSLHPDLPEVELQDGERLTADDVVIATGARARRVPAWGEPPGLHYLRTLADSAALARTLAAAPGRLVVVGGGFIGLEVAGAAVARGWRVTVVEAAQAPLCRVLPAEVAELCVRPLREAAVHFRCGRSVERVQVSDRVTGVDLGDGATIPADAVVVGAGALPNVEWLRGSGVDVDAAVVCDELGRTSRPGIWALGDVARWPNAVTGRDDRVEQWQAARDQGRVVADALLGEERPWKTAPYFWSDLLADKVQFVGWAGQDHRNHVVTFGRRAVCVMGDDRLRAVLTVSSPRHLAAGRRMLIAGESFEAACRWADEQAVPKIAS
jgi:3-phenylpropionate/trans-cinnamate dioxygenase ferredoxin reductase component